MSVEAIGFLPPTLPIEVESGAATINAADGAGSFPQWFSAQLADASDQLAKADRALEGLALGETQNLHHVMLAMEEARLSFQLMVQVRNRVLESYQDLMRMQI